MNLIRGRVGSSEGRMAAPQRGRGRLGPEESRYIHQMHAIVEGVEDRMMRSKS